MSNQPYPQPPNAHKEAAKDSGFALGFKLVLGGCLALVVVAGGACVACSLLFGGAAQLANRNGTVNTPQQRQDQITLQQFNNLYEGQSYSDVCITLNKVGKLDYSSGTGKYKIENYSWDAGFMKSVSATFQNGKLMSKSQFGLE